MMKVLVTGGSGFIGSHVVDKLEARGIDTYVYDLPGVRNPAAGGSTVFIPGSILDLESLREAMIGMDAVYHLAAIADVKDVYEDPPPGNRLRGPDGYDRSTGQPTPTGGAACLR